MPHAAGLYYEEHGSARAPAIVLSSGLGGSAGYWAPNIERLASRYRVIAYDHRGTARSDRTLPPDQSVDDMAGDLLALMDGLGLADAVLIGHALGAAIALSAALQAPARVAGLVLVNGFARLDPHIIRCFDTRLSLLRDSGVAAFVRAQPIFLYPANWCAENAPLLAQEEERQLHDFQGAANVETRIAALRRFDLADRLGEITAATLLITAYDDNLVPSNCSYVIAQGLPKFPMNEEMHSGGHACNVTGAGYFNDVVLSWLATRVKGGQ